MSDATLVVHKSRSVACGVIRLSQSTAAKGELRPGCVVSDQLEQCSRQGCRDGLMLAQ